MLTSFSSLILLLEHLGLLCFKISNGTSQFADFVLQLDNLVS
ncbi:hypothetical protein GT23_3378 [Parageobacillus thermoglucosidasius]|nr:hypothetical protein GT23_3378 [Parageobacillus thermoglucosidasius]